jgi:hypothetical protein
MRSGLLTLLCTCAAAASISCGGGGSGSALTAQPVWLDLLRRIPDTPDARTYVAMNDYARIRGLFQLGAPSQDAGVDEMSDYQLRLSFVGGELRSGSMGISPAQMTGIESLFPFPPAEWNQELGFNLANIDEDVEAGKPPHKYTALRGRFDAKRIDQAVHADPLFKDLLQQDRYGGIAYYTWGSDDQQDLRRRSAVRNLGQGGRLGADGAYLYWTLWTDGMKGMVDAAHAKQRSLADVEEFRLLAQGLGRFDAYSALMSDQGVSFGAIFPELLGPSVDVKAARAALDAAQKSALRPYQALAIGVGQDSQGPFNLLLLVHVDAKTAQENVARLKANIETGKSFITGKPWSDLIQGSEISADGRLLTAKLRTQSRSLLRDIFLRSDSLLIYDQ